MQPVALWWKRRLYPDGKAHAPHAPCRYNLQTVVG